jgi:ribonuclease HII
LSIAAASIIAKTARDSLMRQLDLQYPGYQFSKNKGYGTQTHRAAIQELGTSTIHRLSFTLT